jgi:chromate reductase, NAD(P)H dehydrogenase (quinone)
MPWSGTLPDVKILLVSGSTREASGNTAALRTVRALAPEDTDAIMYEGLTALPAFNPDLDNDDDLPSPARGLRDQIASSDAVLFCTPEYAGTLPGSLKNLLDWTVGGGEMDGKPVGWINVAVGGRGRGAEDHLAMVLRYVGALAVDGACVRLPVPREATAPGGVLPDGTIADVGIRAGLEAVLAALTR